MSYLQDLPVCKLKIDRSFMRAMTVNPRDAAITAAVISMGHSLNLKVLAEGVETEEQMSFLRAHGCDEIQGFYFSKPLEADAFAEKVRTSWLAARFTPLCVETFAGHNLSASRTMKTCSVLPAEILRDSCGFLIPRRVEDLTLPISGTPGLNPVPG